MMFGQAIVCLDPSQSYEENTPKIFLTISDVILEIYIDTLTCFPYSILSSCFNYNREIKTGNFQCFPKFYIFIINEFSHFISIN